MARDIAGRRFYTTERTGLAWKERKGASRWIREDAQDRSNPRTPACSVVPFRANGNGSGEVLLLLTRDAAPGAGIPRGGIRGGGSPVWVESVRLRGKGLSEGCIREALRRRNDRRRARRRWFHAFRPRLGLRNRLFPGHPTSPARLLTRPHDASPRHLPLQPRAPRLLPTTRSSKPGRPSWPLPPRRRRGGGGDRCPAYPVHEGGNGAPARNAGAGARALGFCLVCMRRVSAKRK